MSLVGIYEAVRGLIKLPIIKDILGRIFGKGKRKEERKKAHEKADKGDTSGLDDITNK